jgi:hypothetical protein
MSEMHGLTEPIAIVDIFAMGVKVEDIDHGMRRLLFYAPYGTEQQVCARLIVPVGCLITIVEEIAPHAQKVAQRLLALVPNTQDRGGG